jgi:hypothetical protein
VRLSERQPSKRAAIKEALEGKREETLAERKRRKKAKKESKVKKELLEKERIAAARREAAQNLQTIQVRKSIFN